MDGSLQFSSRSYKHAGNNRHRTGKGRAFPCFINLGGLGTSHDSSDGMLIFYSSGIWFFEFLSGLA